MQEANEDSGVLHAAFSDKALVDDGSDPGQEQVKEEKYCGPPRSSGPYSLNPAF